MTVSDKVAPDDPEKTFLSFSDNPNSSVVIKSVDDENNTQDKALASPDENAQILNSNQKPPRRPSNPRVQNMPLILDTELAN